MAGSIITRRRIPFNLITLALLVAISHSVSFQSLYDRELKSSYGFEIMKHYHDEQFGNNDVKHFKGESMLFMTPWYLFIITFDRRQNGIPTALKYMKKFDYFVPCYYDLNKNFTTNSIELQTSNDYSEEYLQKVKQANPNIKIIPRVFVHGMQGDVFLLASTNDTQKQLMMGYIRQVASNPYYDGILFASPFVTPNHKYPFSMSSMLKDMRKIVKGEFNKLLMTSMEGVDEKPDMKINKKKAREIIDQVDKLIVTNYDYPKGNEGITIPIAPLNWIKQNYDFYCQVYSKSKLTPKLIMALPLYGYFVAMYGKYDPIEGPEMIKKLENQKQAWMTWNEDIHECMIYLNKMEYIYFPCLHFLNSRLRYFEEIKAGVAGFEIGSGLQIFMQMF